MKAAKALKMRDNIFKILIGLIRKPNETWILIQSEEYDRNFVLNSFLLPIILFSGFFKLLGRFINLSDFSATTSILTLLAFIIITFSVIFISSYLINELLPKFKCKKDFTLIFKVISISSFPAIIANGISDLHPYVSFINFISVYSIILFWLGISSLSKIQKEQFTGFVLISLIIIASTLFIISFLIMTLFLSIFINL